MELDKAKSLFTEMDELTNRVEWISALDYFTQRGVLAEIKDFQIDEENREQITGAFYQIELLRQDLLKDLNTHRDEYQAAIKAAKAS